MVSVIKVMALQPDRAFTVEELVAETGRPVKTVMGEIIAAMAYGAIKSVSDRAWQMCPGVTAPSSWKDKAVQHD